MSFRPSMSSVTSGIELLAPLTWRELPGVVTDVWQVAVGRGGQGHYSAPDPRIVAVLGNSDSEMRLARGGARAQPIRIGFVPAGMAMRSSFRRPGQLAHLDIHFRQAALIGRLVAAGMDTETLIHQPRLLASAAPAEALAEAMAEEIRGSHFSGAALDAVLDRLLAELFAPVQGEEKSGIIRGGLTPGQLARVDRLMREELHRPVSVAEMAAAADLSESWFAHAWSQSRGEPPHRVLQRLRIERAKALLSESDQSLATVAQDAGFADQAHFTRCFRKLTGETPGLWRRRLAGSR